MPRPSNDAHILDFLSWWDTLTDEQQCQALDRLRQEAALLSDGTRLLSAAHPLLYFLSRINPEFPLN